MVNFLLVDDNPTFRRVLRNLLEQHDDWHVCEEASDGAEGVATFNRCSPDIVVLDFQMPHMNGLDAAREMREHSPHTPILMVTLYLSRQLNQEAQKVGIRGTCAKTDPACVINAAAALLDNRTYFPN